MKNRWTFQFIWLEKGQILWKVLINFGIPTSVSFDIQKIKGRLWTEQAFSEGKYHSVIIF